MKKAIFLSGGGARGAYQAGALKAIYEITRTKNLPAEILSSVSAGAINAAFLTLHAKDFPCAVNDLIKLWSSLCCDRVFRTSNYALIKSVLRNVFSLVFHYQAKGGGYLLDTQPLKELLESNLDFEKMNNNIEQGLLESLEVATSCYEYAETVSFFKAKNKKGWKSIGHKAVPTNIQCEHILASASLPLFFPAVEINDYHYGDGGLQLMYPLSAAIRLGADNILIIGTRNKKSETLTPIIGEVTFAKILGNMFNSLFFDNLDKDLDLLSKINNHIKQCTSEKPEKGWRKINTLYLRPSQNLGKLAEGTLSSLPILLRYLISVFGKKEQSGDILSFLIFEPKYCKKLIEIGYEDTMNQKEAVANFFK